MNIIAEKFNNLNSQLIQYWWYWFSSITIGGVLLFNAYIDISLFGATIKGVAGGSGIILPILWIFSIIAIIIIFVVSSFLYLLQLLLPIKQSLFSHPLIILQQKRLSILILLLNSISTFVNILFIIWLCMPKN